MTSPGERVEPGTGRRAPVRRAGWLALFAVTMGVLEAAVVVYLRELFYPDGFGFPAIIIPDRLAQVEMVREATTILMLLCVAALSARDRHDGFFVFGLLFGVWDIFYYVGLWAFLGWPSSLVDWDLLFLIPVPWLSPVAYPLVVSCCLIAGFAAHELRWVRGSDLRLGVTEWLVAAAGAAVVAVSFCWNWRVVPEERIPGEFPVVLFLVGLAVGALPFARAIVRGAAASPLSARNTVARTPPEA